MPKYPEACDLKPEELQRNQQQFRWFTQQCARRNIRVLLHFYNIHLSEPMAKAHNLPINPRAPTPLLKEYTHYALSRFFEEFDSVGLYICPGESLQEAVSVGMVPRRDLRCRRQEREEPAAGHSRLDAGHGVPQAARLALREQLFGDEA